MEKVSKNPTLLPLLVLLAGAAASTSQGLYRQFKPSSLSPAPSTRDPRAGPQDATPAPDPWFGTDDLSDPRTKGTEDPRTRAADPLWTYSGPALAGGSVKFGVDAADAPKAALYSSFTPAQNAARAYTRASTSQSSDNPPSGAINAINVISSVYSRGQPNTVGGNPAGSSAGNPGRSTLSGSTARCMAAIRECSLFDVDVPSLGDVYQQAFATMLRKQRLQYQGDLRKARDFFINMFNQLILNPEQAAASLGNSASCAQAAAQPVSLWNDPTRDIPSPSQVPEVTVQQPQDCVVSEWSAWSIPLGFGVVERNRTIIGTGQCRCPKDLVERIDVSEYLRGNNSIFEEPNQVADNFNNAFLTNEPRDILLVIDTSSSIFTTDFEVMKQGINSMIDLFCGGFGNNATSHNRLAILQFSTSSYVHHYFSDPQTPQALKDAVDRMDDFGGRTCTGDALLAAYHEVWLTSRGARANVPNDTLVITDGHANCGADLVQATGKLQERSKSIYALGIGIANDVVAKAQVKSLVTNSDDHHIFSLARYINFKEMIDYIHKNGKKCTPIVDKPKSVPGK